MISKVFHGIVHGRTIELEDDLGMADGSKVEIVVRVSALPGPPPEWRAGGTETAAGMMHAHWSEEDNQILEQIEQDRKRDKRRKPIE